jgi:hypothetical protein
MGTGVRREIETSIQTDQLYSPSLPQTQTGTEREGDGIAHTKSDSNRARTVETRRRP